MDKDQREYKRHKIIWKILRPIVKPILFLLFGFRSKLAPKMNEPYLVLSNHNTDLDPALIAMSFPTQMYFVASEHVYRHGLVSKILYWTFKPIAKIKGASDATTVMQCIRMLRSGKNVCLFPEGNRSYNGLTGDIFDNTGKLVKVSNVALITYKLEGGYFTTPRWGYGIRRGKMKGYVVNVYSKDKLKEMSVTDITEAIKKDLYEDAYERQNNDRVKFKSAKPILGLESALCVCPECKKISTLTSSNTQLICNNCSFYTSLDKYGFFTKNSNHKNFIFNTIKEWDDFQTKHLKKVYETHTDFSSPLFCDIDLTLNQILKEHETQNLGFGTLYQYKDKILFESLNKEVLLELPMDKITDMSIYGKYNLVWTDNQNNHYEIKSDKLINSRKYLCIFNVAKGDN